VDEGDREPVYYYSREHRLKRASARVRNLNEEQTKKSRFFGNPAANRANLLIFMSLILICVFFAITSRVLAKQGMELGGNTLSITLVEEEGILILGIVKTAPQSGEFYAGDVELSVSPIMPPRKEGEAPPDETQVFYHRIVFNPVETEAYRFSLPFEGSAFFVILRTADEQKSTRVNVKR
jgi:hypothetical protein